MNRDIGGFFKSDDNNSLINGEQNITENIKSF